MVAPSEAPEDLARFIELINADRLFERELPNLDDEVDAAMGDPQTAPFSTLRGLWTRVCGEIAGTLSAETRSFLGPEAALRQFQERYRSLKVARQAILGIARSYRNDTSKHARSSADLIVRGEWLSEDVPFQVGVGLVVSASGQLAISEDAILNALVGVRADRIRSCAICGRIFWAARVNSECCGEVCRKTYNQRNSRRNRQRGRMRNPPAGFIAQDAGVKPTEPYSDGAFHYLDRASGVLKPLAV